MTHDPITEKLEAVHLGFDATSGVIAGPFLPDGSVQTSCPRCFSTLGRTRRGTGA